jgi:DNA-binding CsgD family transcriptional regulator/PAS domain-containing protein
MLISRMQDPDLIAGFYEAASDPAQWEPTWAAVCRAFKAPAGLLYHQPDSTSPPRVLAATSHWGQTRPSVPPVAFASLAAAGDMPVQYRTMLGHEVFSPQSWDGTDGGNAACQNLAAGTYHVLGASVPLDGSGRAGIGLHRPIDAPAFDENDRAALDGVTRHLAAALRLAGALEAERLASAMRAAALHGLRHGVVIVGADGTIAFANDAARALAKDGGLLLGPIGDVLSCVRAAEADRLAMLIRGAVDDGGNGCTRITRGARQSLLAAVVTPLAPALSCRRALVIVRDLGDPCDAAQTHLAALFALSGAESAILPQLLAGDSASLIAQSRGVQVATIRTQVTRVLAKTGAANLRALASMMAALA